MQTILLTVLTGLLAVLGGVMFYITIDERGGDIKRSIVNILLTILLFVATFFSGYFLLR